MVPQLTDKMMVLKGVAGFESRDLVVDLDWCMPYSAPGRENLGRLTAETEKKTAF